jgi:hypothetical protein
MRRGQASQKPSVSVAFKLWSATPKGTHLGHNSSGGSEKIPPPPANFRRDLYLIDLMYFFFISFPFTPRGTVFLLLSVSAFPRSPSFLGLLRTQNKRDLLAHLSFSTKHVIQPNHAHKDRHYSLIIPKRKLRRHAGPYPAFWTFGFPDLSHLPLVSTTARSQSLSQRRDDAVARGHNEERTGKARYYYLLPHERIPDRCVLILAPAPVSPSPFPLCVRRRIHDPAPFSSRHLQHHSIISANRPRPPILDKKRPAAVQSYPCS